MITRQDILHAALSALEPLDNVNQAKYEIVLEVITHVLVADGMTAPDVDLCLSMAIDEHNHAI